MAISSYNLIYRESKYIKPDSSFYVIYCAYVVTIKNITVIHPLLIENAIPFFFFCFVKTHFLF